MYVISSSDEEVQDAGVSGADEVLAEFQVLLLYLHALPNRHFSQKPQNRYPKSPLQPEPPEPPSQTAISARNPRTAILLGQFSQKPQYRHPKWPLQPETPNWCCNPHKLGL